MKLRYERGALADLDEIFAYIAFRKEKWRLLLPGASEPRLTELNPSGL